VLIIGWVVAHIMQFIVRKVLKLIRFDKIAEKTGIVVILKDADVSMRPSIWFSKFVYWVIMVSAILTALDELRLGVPAFQIDQIAVLVFTIFGVLIVFIIGLVMSIIVSRITQTTAENLKVEKPQAYSRTMKWSVLIFTILLILRQLAVPIEFVLIAVSAVFVTLCLTFIIAFGTGGSGWAGKVLDKFFK